MEAREATERFYSLQLRKNLESFSAWDRYREGQGSHSIQLPSSSYAATSLSHWMQTLRSWHRAIPDPKQTLLFQVFPHKNRTHLSLQKISDSALRKAATTKVAFPHLKGIPRDTSEANTRVWKSNWDGMRTSQSALDFISEEAQWIGPSRSNRMWELILNIILLILYEKDLHQILFLLAIIFVVDFGNNSIRYDNARWCKMVLLIAVYSGRSVSFRVSEQYKAHMLVLWYHPCPWKQYLKLIIPFPWVFGSLAISRYPKDRQL